MELLPFVHEELPLSLKAAGHVLPVCQSLEPSAEDPEKEVPRRGSAAVWPHRALLQIDRHLLEDSTAKTLTLSSLSPNVIAESLGLAVTPTGTLRWVWEKGLHWG